MILRGGGFPAPGLALFLLALPVAPALAADPADIILPSGWAVRALDTVQGVPGPEGLALRMRFVAPDLAAHLAATAAAQAGAGGAETAPDPVDVPAFEDDLSGDAFDPDAAGADAAGPDAAGMAGADPLLADLTWLCDTQALPALAGGGPQPAQIIISVADRPVPFGAPNPEAVQVFEAFRPENGRCVWEFY
ncbi:DUF6497 family protein [Phaeovulum vinaykumarii]|uniref:Uncharacterized protein n=1 Tax=Phaeovulum vinaykumarii TaxID=407234 RepID=A0A1N7K5R1_9RHOB|nr:DUF6497 family protein [Phaeovulum vinaykumarii]SIS56932.1 hypothetical protein SAMN05421795_101637 [Phaeovulum vinaykumarii]SOB93212.1 hypothetical protein SAMN05878426_101634 [Phaeovulum vinaykumarii]